MAAELHTAHFLCVLMGVSGSGKSTLAQHLAERLGLRYIEADDLHSAENRRHMASGQALSDDMREPWITAICDRVLAEQNGTVLACSALRRNHRHRFRKLAPQVIFFHLRCSREALTQRIDEREAHFMPATLLDSQLETLESTANESDVIELDTESELDQLICDIQATLQRVILGIR